ncbi:hypothetical protein BGX38DRAFT_1250326 [Terfezia claveryi]|nr:hypothetical protein BGX38DRAFT_1250326 [Terfezia claveryi]
MAANRSAGRDVHIYGANDPTTVLGGLIVTNGITNANFYSMVEVFLNDEDLRRGSYFIVTDGTVTVNNEEWLVRTISVNSGTRVAEFRETVRQRDRRCVITGQSAVNARGDIGLRRWITLHPSSGESINSVQNGLLLRSDEHALFHAYGFSINPDESYKVVCFNTDKKRPAVQLLCWHFRQAVLANMRGAGEPVFECDFLPGSDMMDEIMSGPMTATRMEFEVFSRLESH